ncbi:MAG: hypothetical protein ACPGEG_10130, partial [Salibacteraceae bacterium]
MNEEAHKIARKIERLRREFSMLATLESRHNPLEIEEYQHYLLELEELLIVFKYLMDPSNQPVEPISNESQIIEEAVSNESSVEDIHNDTIEVELEAEPIAEIEAELEEEQEEAIETEPELTEVPEEQALDEEEAQEPAEEEFVEEEIIEEKEENIVDPSDSEYEEAPSIEEEEQPAEPEKSKFPSGSSLNDRVSAKDDSLAGKLARQPIADLRKAFGLNERFLYANELFGGDGQEFIRALNELNHLESFEDAKRMIEARYQNTFKWNLEDETVLEF